jgi:hypothetical protein
MDMKTALSLSAALTMLAGQAVAEMRFEPVADMTVPASQHRDALLPNGTVLITGGQSGEGGIVDAQIYDPATKAFTSAGKMTEPRFVHAMNLLDDGRVLITAGFSKSGQFLQSSEFYDGEKFIKGPDLVENRDNQRTINLKNGKIFIEGGDSEKLGYIASTEIFNPKDGTYTAGPVLPTGRAMDAITPLKDGKVLMTGGMKIVDFKQVFLSETVIYDPKSNSAKLGPKLNTARKQHRASALKDGSILVTGGMNDKGALRSAELYKNGKFKKLPDMSAPRLEHCSAQLPDGRVLIAGGYANGNYTNTTEIYNPSSKKFTPGPAMIEARGFQTCTVLKDGSVLVAGGNSPSGAIKSAEILVL